MTSKPQLTTALALALSLFVCAAAHAQITPLGDSYTNSADPTTNYGAATTLGVDGTSQVTYIQFNLASIPSGASVGQATLKLYVNAVTKAGSFNVDYVNGSWSEATIDYSNAPALGTTIAANVPITTADKNQYILINVTSAVEAWLNGSQANDGIALVANSTFNATFDSKENTTTSHPAELDIVFAGAGTITGVETASGSGLQGGGTSGTLNLSLTTACAANQVLAWNGSAWACSSAGTGTITGVTAGTDLTGGGPSGNVTLNLNTTALNSSYAQLGAVNTFTAQQNINAKEIITASSSYEVVEVTQSGGTGDGIHGNTTSTTGNGVVGNATAGSGPTAGVLGTTQSINGAGVEGTSSNVGVYGQVSGASVTGSDGIGFDAGVWGDTGGTSDNFEAVLGTADDNIAGDFFNDSGSDTSLSGATLYAYNFSSDKSPLIFAALASTGDACTITTGGIINCNGSNINVATADGSARRVTLHAMESPENWFEDFGSGALVNGSATVALDPTFASTVNTTTEYHVFLTPKGDCKGLYVANETATGFEVGELGGGRSNVAFDYRIVAKRAGYENQRLEDVTERYQKMQEDQRLRRERMQQRRSERSASVPAAAPEARAIAAPVIPVANAAPPAPPHTSRP